MMPDVDRTGASAQTSLARWLPILSWARRYDRRWLATDLVAELLDMGVPGVHLYALNRAQSIQEIYANLGREGQLRG